MRAFCHAREPALLKRKAFLGFSVRMRRVRDRIRDLYDAAWLVNEHLDELSPALREQFEVAIDEQTDEFFDKEKLLTMVLEANERLSLRDGGGVACADRILERAGSTPTPARTPLRTDNAAVMVKSIR